MKNILSLSILLLFIGCTNNAVISDNVKYTIDLDNLKLDDKPIKLSSIFKEVRTIIPKETGDILIGEIKSIQLVGNTLFILDQDLGNPGKLLLFNRDDGTFLRQIGNAGLGPGEYIEIKDFSIDEARKHVYSLDRGVMKINIHNYESGEFLDCIKISDEMRQYTSCDYILYKNDKLYVSLISIDKEKDDNMLFEIDLKNKNEKKYLSSIKHNLGFNKGIYNEFSFFYSKAHETPKYKQRFMNTLFAIAKDSIYPYLTVSSKNWAKESDIQPFEDLIKELKSQSHVFAERNRAYEIRSFIEWGDNFFFEISIGWDSNYLLYNKKTGDYTYTKNLENDLVLSKGKAYTKFIYTTPNAAYGIIQLSDYTEEISAGNYIYATDLDKREQLENMAKTEEEGFVIFEYIFE